MAENDGNGYSKGVQVSSTINGDLFNFRAGDGSELSELLGSVAEYAEQAVTSLTTFKQAVVAHGVFTGNANPNAAGPAKTAGATGAPPSSGVPTCAHGAMKDLAGKGYKKRYYCPQPRGQQQCPAQD